MSRHKPTGMTPRMELLERVEELVAAGLPEDQQPLSAPDHADEKSQSR